MLLLLTNSLDGTADIMCKLAGERGVDVFRFNTDLFLSYSLRITADDFTITDPTGRTVSEATLTACYWRKPFISGDDPSATFPTAEQTWVREHLRVLVREIANLARSTSRLRLVDPHAERRLGKLVQMRLAKPLFSVPTWDVVLNHHFTSAAQRVVKTLSPELIDTERLGFLFTTPIIPAELDPRYPWFVQNLAPGQKDATLVFVFGQMRAFSPTRTRDKLGIDWRVRIGDSDLQWEEIAIPDAISEAVSLFMHRANLHYGRLDFIVDDDIWHFLEVNPNGQFGWLDAPDFRLHNLILTAVLDTRTALL